jgi:hypothetical protein
MNLLVVVIGLLTWARVTLLLDAWWRGRSRLDLTERLRPFHPSIGDEAQRWLRGQ